jgi:hypothetical protein
MFILWKTIKITEIITIEEEVIVEEVIIIEVATTTMAEAKTTEVAKDIKMVIKRMINQLFNKTRSK